MKFLTICFLLFTCFHLSGQAEFEMPIFFEDAIGNKDTIYIGYDHSAKFKGFNEHLGEVEIKTPFDSVFEVRALHSGGATYEISKSFVADSNYRFSKKIIGSIEPLADPPQNFGSGTTIFVISAKYLPVTIRWDSDIIKNDANFGDNSSFFCPDEEIFLYPDFTWGGGYKCMLTNDPVIVDDFTYKNVPPWFQRNLKAVCDVEGKGKQTLNCYYQAFTTSQSQQLFYCSKIVSTQDWGVPQFLFSPNPAKDVIQIDMGKVSTWEATIFSISGNRIESTTFEQTRNFSMNTSNLESGVYYFSVKTPNGLSANRLFVKL